MKLEDLYEETQHLQAQIRAHETLYAELEHECAEIRQTLDAFEQRYNRIVKPLADQLDAVKKAVERLQALYLKQQMGSDEDLESLLRGERQARAEHLRAARNRDDDAATLPEELPSAAKATGADIKALYRQLARLYHPDLAADQDDRNHRNAIMALINRAYSDNDIDTLMTLQDASPDAVATAAPSHPQLQQQVSSEYALAMMTLRHLQKHHEELQDRLVDLRRERDELRYSHMMTMNLEAKIAQSKGYDYLQRMIEDIQEEYQEYLEQLDALRDVVR
jgi:predicted RNase H-like nuclease (RuvC/YqgF family)